MIHKFSDRTLSDKQSNVLKHVLGLGMVRSFDEFVKLTDKKILIKYVDVRRTKTEYEINPDNHPFSDYIKTKLPFITESEKIFTIINGTFLYDPIQNEGTHRFNLCYLEFLPIYYKTFYFIPRKRIIARSHIVQIVVSENFKFIHNL